MYVVSTVAVGVDGKIAQGVINWSPDWYGFLFGCSSTAQIFVDGARLPLYYKVMHNVKIFLWVIHENLYAQTLTLF